MSWMEFVASLAKSLSWPLFAGILVIAFRKTIATALSERVTHLKLGPLEIDLEKAERLRIAVEREQLSAPAGEPPSTETQTQRSEVEDRLALAEASPVGAFIESYIGLERTLASALETNPAGPFRKFLDEAVGEGIFTKDDAEAFLYVRAARNAVMHNRRDLTAAQSLELIGLVDALRRAVETRRIARATGRAKSSGTAVVD